MSVLPFLKCFSGLVAIKGKNKRSKQKAVQTAGRLTSRSSRPRYARRLNSSVMASMKMNRNIQNLKQWIESNRDRLIGYSDVSAIGHDAIDCALVRDNVIAGIESGRLSAIELGADFVLADFRSPFGKAQKC